MHLHTALIPWKITWKELLVLPGISLCHSLETNFVTSLRLSVNKALGAGFVRCPSSLYMAAACEDFGGFLVKRDSASIVQEPLPVLCFTSAHPQQGNPTSSLKQRGWDFLTQPWLNWKYSHWSQQVWITSHLVVWKALFAAVELRRLVLPWITWVGIREENCTGINGVTCGSNQCTKQQNKDWREAYCCYRFIDLMSLAHKPVNNTASSTYVLWNCFDKQFILASR